jgi:hypothetical protein
MRIYREPSFPATHRASIFVNRLLKGTAEKL